MPLSTATTHAMTHKSLPGIAGMRLRQIFRNFEMKGRITDPYNVYGVPTTGKGLATDDATYRTQPTGTSGNR